MAQGWAKLTWANGMTEDGRPIVVPGSEPTVGGSRVCPSTAGATNWPAPTYDPDTKLFYLIVQEGCGITYKSSSNFKAGMPGSGTGYMESPADQENWQLYVKALDLSGKTVWSYMQVDSNHYGPGLLSTAGGIIFALPPSGIAGCGRNQRTRNLPNREAFRPGNLIILGKLDGQTRRKSRGLRRGGSRQKVG